ncbi:fumarylacetoacetate hydrolase family protein [Novosphingobium sp. PASSN1]|uniref:fumarylacetoacetate hydrolase family protein n=1 Tax=Novosphingobium sp. PASSN1 TaxID=2015561 RepID=UPI0025CEC2D5|nr:fumarylacetoacetate hydrolase family protein [Novosphingobium sp. PASSN1]
MTRLAGAPVDLKSALATSWLADLPDGGQAERFALADLSLLPPVPNPGKVLCVVTNFHEPERGAKPVPEYPLVFTRFADSFTGHGQPLTKSRLTEKYDYEGELAVIIGRPGYRIGREQAMDHVAGYTCLNDGSMRDWQKHSTQFPPGKNFYRSGSMGPWLVTADELPDLAAMRLETRVNGEVRQAIGMDRMIFDIAWLIAYFSSFTPLAPGDIIATGTPSGFGSSRDPALFLQAGDVVEVEISGIGVLHNMVCDEAAGSACGPA